MAVGESGEDTAPPLLAPLRALAALIPDAAGIKGEPEWHVAEGLTEAEAEAVQEFFVAGQRCLGQLSGATITDLSRISRNARLTSRLSTSSGFSLDAVPESCQDEGRIENVYDMFDRFDTDHDGYLSLDDFRVAFNALTGGKFNDDQVGQIISAADVNNDGFIDVHEFTVWLYEAQGRPVDDENGGFQLSLRAKLDAAEAELLVKKRALGQLEFTHDEEIAAIHDFWRSVAQHCVLNINQKIDLSTATWLGNGKYGFVLKATRRKDNREVVVKMMGTRWAHLAVKEWQHGSMVGVHPNIIEYEEVMLHADDDKTISKLLQTGYKQGKLKSRNKRSKFPDRFICLTQEYMNRGTVQDWMDRKVLNTGGVLAVLRRVANALAYMHRKQVTHNDIKPENVMLHQESPNDRDVQVKVGDLGLARKSTDSSTDYWQYGMTAFCMTVGGRFGAQKYTPEKIDDFARVMARSCEKVGQKFDDERLAGALNEVPALIRKVFLTEVSMDEVSEWPSMQDWGFFETGMLASQSTSNFLRTTQIHDLQDSSHRRVSLCMGAM